MLKILYSYTSIWVFQTGFELFKYWATLKFFAKLSDRKWHRKDHQSMFVPLQNPMYFLKKEDIASLKEFFVLCLFLLNPPTEKLSS